MIGAALTLVAVLSDDPMARRAPVETDMVSFPWVETVAERGGSPTRSYSRMQFHRVVQRHGRPDTGISPYWMVRLERTRFDPQRPTTPLVEVYWVDQRRCPAVTGSMDTVPIDPPFTAYAPQDITRSGAAMTPHGAHWTVSRYGQSGEDEVMTTWTDRTGRVLREPLAEAERQLEPCIADLTPAVPASPPS